MLSTCTKFSVTQGLIQPRAERWFSQLVTV
jgi:hypothetical protein